MKHMFRRLWRLSLLTLTLAAAVLPAVPPAQAQASVTAASAVQARVIVRFKAQAQSVRAKALSAHAQADEARQIAQTRATGLGLRQGRVLSALASLDERTHVITASGIGSAALAQSLALDSEVELVAVDQRRRATLVPNDALYAGNGGIAPPTGVSGSANGQWYLKPVNGTVVSGINAQGAWDLTTGSASVVVAVLDTGVRFDHPDLAGKLLPGYDMIADVATGNDGDGRDSDASDPGDWVSQADIDGKKLSGCTVDDIGNSSWHGTRVAGLIGAASNNGAGIAGTAWGSKILPVRVLGKCGGYDSDIWAGMRWAAGIAVPGLPANPTPAKVLNMSLGGDGSCTDSSSTATLYRQAVADVMAKGAVVVAAAGNSAGHAVGIPGNCAGVITVTGLRHVGTKVGFSSIGPEVSLSAPGGNCVNLSGPCLYPMLSSTNSGTTTPVLNDAAYTNSDASVGTSFSAPLASGTAALLLSVRPGLTPAELLSVLKGTTRPFVTSGGSSGTLQCVAPTSTDQLECYCTTSTCGAGMMDAAAAVQGVSAANSMVAVIGSSPATAVAGQVLTLSASLSPLPAGRSIVAANWTITSGGGIVSGFSAGANSVSATLTPSAAGSFSVQVVAVDNLGLSYTQTATVTVAAATTPTTPSAPSTGSGGGGGGALGWEWLLGLAAAVLALAWPRRARQG